MLQSSQTYGSTKNPSKIVILLHGLGSNGKDLIGLAPYFAKTLPNTLFISPNAPFACDMVPAGYPDSYQWFSLQNRDPDVVLKGIQTAQPLLYDYIQAVLDEYNVKACDCALVGFSQGTMMSLYTAPRYDGALAGVLGYSGALFVGDTSELKHKTPVHLLHGEADDVVPVAAFSDAKQSLTAQGIPFSGYTQPGLTHSIDEKGIESGSAFLNSVLFDA